MTLLLADDEAAISPARSMTAVLDTRPDRMMASSLTLTAIASPGKSVCRCCSRAVIAGSTTMSYWRRVSAPQTIRLTVPAFLPSTRISRGCTTTASAISGLVMAMRVTSKSVETTVDRPDVTTTRSYCGRGVAAAGAAAEQIPAGCPAASAARPGTRRRCAVLDSKRLSTSSSNNLLTSLGPSDCFNRVDLRRRRHCRLGLNRLRRSGRTRGARRRRRGHLRLPEQRVGPRPRRRRR